MDTLKTTILQREAQYGSFSDVAAISQQFEEVFRVTKGYKKMSPEQKEAVKLITHKLSRLLAGNPDHIDSWHDIAGYSYRVQLSLEEKNAGQPASDVLKLRELPPCPTGVVPSGVWKPQACRKPFNESSNPSPDY